MNNLTFKSNQVIFKQGSFGEGMFDIVSGRVGIYADYGTPDEKMVAELGSDEIFGEMGMIEVYPRSATAVALEDDTKLSEITEKEFADYFGDKPEKMLKVLRLLSRRIRETNQKYIDVCRAAYQNDQAEKQGAAKGDQLNKELDRICETCKGFRGMWLD